MVRESGWPWVGCYQSLPSAGCRVLGAGRSSLVRRGLSEGRTDGPQDRAAHCFVEDIHWWFARSMGISCRLQCHVPYEHQMEFRMSPFQYNFLRMHLRKQHTVPEY